MKYNKEIEMSVIGCLLSPEIAEGERDEIISSLDLEDFYFSANKIVLKILKIALEQKIKIDLVTVTTILESLPELKREFINNTQFDFPTYLYLCIDGVPTVANLQYYVEKLKELALRRKIYRLSSEFHEKIREVCEDELTDIRDIIAIWEDRPKLEYEVIQAKRIKSLTEILNATTKIDYICENLIANPALTILAGRSKIGKSFFALQLSRALVRHEPFLDLATKRTAVLYCALEDSSERIAQRLIQLGGMEGNEPLSFAFTPLSDPEILRWKEETEAEHHLLIIDTFGRWRSTPNTKTPLFDQDYNEVSKLARLAQDEKISILLIHHTRKTSSLGSSFVEELSGTMGISAGADTIAVLSKNSSGNFKLQITGRDILESEFNLRFNLKWEKADPFELNSNEEYLLNLIKENPNKPLKEIQELSGFSRPSFFRILRSLKEKTDVKIH